MKTVMKMRIKTVIKEKNHPVNISRPVRLLEAIKLLPKLMEIREKHGYDGNRENDNPIQRDTRKSEIGNRPYLRSPIQQKAISVIFDLLRLDVFVTSMENDKDERERHLL